VKGESYSGTALYPGQGGEEMLKQWVGWKKGKDFEVENGGLVRKESSKL
jgi:alpha-methylacyl-CoA racemase